MRSFAEHLKPGAWVAPANLDAEDGTFHPADTQGVYHDGFDSGEFQAILESNGFKDVYFVTAHTVIKEGNTYPIFLVTAARGLVISGKTWVVINNHFRLIKKVLNKQVIF